MGVYEITALGNIEDQKTAKANDAYSSREAQGQTSPFVRPFQRKVRTVVKVFDILRHTNQYHFEKVFQSDVTSISSKDNRKYVVTWPEPIEALTELYTLGSLRDGRVELAGLLDGQRKLVQRNQRRRVCLDGWGDRIGSQG